MNNQSRVCEICSKETKKLGTHLRVEHKMTSEEYYNKYLSEDHGGKCPFKDCNNMRPYRSMEVGYRQFCSKSCASKHNQDQPKLKEILRERNKTLMKGRHADPIFAKAHSERMSKRLTEMHKDPEFAKAHMERVNKTTLDGYLARAKSAGVDKGIFYIMKYKDFIKIGICYLINNKLGHFNARKHSLRPIDYELYSGNIIEVSNYEYLIKSQYIPYKDNEYFPLDLYDEIKSKIPNTILPYSTLVV